MIPYLLASPDLRAAHAQLLQYAREANRRRFRAQFAASAETGSTGITYQTEIVVGGVAFLVLNGDFFDRDDRSRLHGHFSGEGGNAIGAGLSWGNSIFEQSIESLSGKRAYFEITVQPLTLTINWWNDKGALATFVGAGPVAGTGTTTGNGVFRER